MLSPTCTPNAAAAYAFFTRMGLRPFQAAAIVGNLQQESGRRLNPSLEVIDTNGLPSRGIAMWQPPRWQRLLSFAAGRDPWALETQLEFLWHELRATPALGFDQLIASTTLEDATVIFQDKFERCGICHTPRRITNARDVLAFCPTVQAPSETPRTKPILAFAGLLAFTAAAGYGADKALTFQRRSRRRR